MSYCKLRYAIKIHAIDRLTFRDKKSFLVKRIKHSLRVNSVSRSNVVLFIFPHIPVQSKTCGNLFVVKMMYYIHCNKKVHIQELLRSCDTIVKFIVKSAALKINME